MSGCAVSTVVLAAGASTRMGRQKLLLPLGARTLLQRTLDAIVTSGVHETIVVLGCDADAIERTIRDMPVRVVRNPHWAEGIGTSVRVGMSAMAPDAAAAVFCSGDQPWLTAALIGSLIERWRATGMSIVAPRHRARQGNPVLFDRRLFPALRAVWAEEGGRQVMSAHLQEVAWVQLDDPQPLQDVDTEEDYRLALRTFAARDASR